MKLEDVNIYDPDLYVKAVPHETFALLRAQEPVFWQELPEGAGYWALLKHADVMAASKDWQTFSAARGGIIIEDQSPQQLAAMRTQLLSMDPPEHIRIRRIVLDAFTPTMIADMEPWLRARAREIMQAAAEKRECDFVRDLAAELPLQTINQIMAIPEADRLQIVELGDKLIGRTDPEVAAREGAANSATELGAYGFKLASERKGRGGKDLISLMLNAELEGHPLNEVEFAALFVQIAVAGNETSRSLLAGAMLAVGTIAVVVLAGRVLRRGARWAGLGLADRAAGAVLGVAEGALVVGILLGIGAMLLGRDHPVLTSSLSFGALEQLERIAQGPAPPGPSDVDVAAPPASL